MAEVVPSRPLKYGRPSRRPAPGEIVVFFELGDEAVAERHALGTGSLPRVGDHVGLTDGIPHVVGMTKFAVTEVMLANELCSDAEGDWRPFAFVRIQAPQPTTEDPS